jgi:hypothetical protein
MADVFRRKYTALSGKAMFGYLFHGSTAILSLWMIMKALGA